MRKYSLRAAIAGALAIALVGGGAAAANAAPKNPSPDSTSTFYLFDENGESAESDLSFTRTTILSMASSETDPFAEIMPADYVSAADLATPGLQVWSFISTEANVNTGTNGWSAWAQSAAAGPNGGVAFGNFTAGELAEGNINKVFQDGGSYRLGLAWTINNGVTVVGKTYRIVNVQAGTNNFTVEPLEPEAPVAFPNWSQFSATAGASAVLRNGNLVIDATAANAGKTVKLYTDGQTTATGSDIVLDAAGKAIVSSSIAANTRIALADDTTGVDAWITTTAFAWTQPTEAANAGTKVAIANPTAGEFAVVIPVGADKAGQQFAAVGWSTPTDLGLTGPVGADGNVTIDASALGNGDHTIALFGANDQPVAWGTVTFAPKPEAEGSPAITDVSVAVTTSNRFELNAAAAVADLGEIRRGQTTAPKRLGAFTVIDDRDELPGWNLNVAVADFVNAEQNGDVVGKSALGINPIAVNGLPTGVTTAAAQAAGAGVYTAAFAEGGANSSTLEAGTQFDADLTFKAPASAKKGTYASTLTFTLVSK